jgi:hypothetical protein
MYGLLNGQGGRHWIKRSYHETLWFLGARRLRKPVQGVEPEQCYCLVGAARELVGPHVVVHSPERDKRIHAGQVKLHALKSLAQVLEDEGIRKQLRLPADAVTTDVEHLVIRFNDSAKTTWDDVNRVLRKARRRAQARARKAA